MNPFRVLFSIMDGGAGTDQYFSSVQLLLHGDGTDASTTFTDSSSAARTCTAGGNAQIDTAQSKWGGASMLFDGAGDNLQIADAASLDMRAGAFTIEAWVRLNSVGVQCLMSKMSVTTGLSYEWAANIQADYALFYHGIRGTNQSQLKLFWPTTLTTATWYFVQIQRNSSGDFAVFLDGVPGTQYQVSPLAVGISYGSVITGTYTNAIDLGDTANPIRVGMQHDGAAAFDGHIDDLRYTVGIARGASVPVAAFPNT